MKSLSRVQLLATTWTAARQAPPSMGFSRQEYWSGVPLPSPGKGMLKGQIQMPQMYSIIFKLLFSLFNVYLLAMSFWLLSRILKMLILIIFCLKCQCFYRVICLWSCLFCHLLWSHSSLPFFLIYQMFGLPLSILRVISAFSNIGSLSVIYVVMFTPSLSSVFWIRICF